MNLKNLKFPLGVIINVLTAIVFGYVCFLATNFETLGNKEKSIITALFIIVSLIVTSLGAKLLKQTTNNFKTGLILECILLLLYTGIMFYATYQYFSHYFVVEARKTEIQTSTNTNISQAESIYRQYQTYVDDRLRNYNGQLASAVRSKGGAITPYTKLGFNPLIKVNDVIQTKNLIFKLESALLPTNYKSMKVADSTWLADARVSVNNWEPIKLVDVINDIENNSNNSLNELIAFSNHKAKNEAASEFSLNPTIPFSNVKDNFTTHGSSPPVAILFAILTWLLMLLPWFISKRDTRSVGARTTAKYEVVL